MSEKIRGIVLGMIKHSDRHNIMNIYTRERGRMSFLSPVGSGKSARLRNARLLPFSVIETDVRINPVKELVLLGRFSVVEVRHSLYFNPVKQTLTLFLREFLDKLLRSSAPDMKMYEYLERGISFIDNAPEDRCSNLHIAFLTGLLSPAGIYPNLEDWQPGDRFDMRGGEFVALKPLHNDCLTPADSAKLMILMRMTMRNAARFRFNAEERRRILTLLLRYYSIHFPGLSNMKSLDILSEIYRD